MLCGRMDRLSKYSKLWVDPDKLQQRIYILFFLFFPVQKGMQEQTSEYIAFRSGIDAFTDMSALISGGM